MNKFKNSSHMIDLVFALALFCLFAASALSAVLLGANVYRFTVKEMAANNTSRTALSYVTEKIRQNDSSGNVYLVTEDNTTAVALDQTHEGTTYTTLLYSLDGYLRELSIRKDHPVSLSAGQEILPLDLFQAEETKKGLFHITLAAPDAESAELYLHPRSE